MDGNSPKLPETIEMSVSTLRVLRDWLDREGGNQRIPQVLDLLAQRTAADVIAGHPCPGLDAETLRQLYFHEHGGRVPDTLAARWLASGNVRRWWAQRREAIEQACRDAHLTFTPELALQAGGGRSNTTLYRLDFRPLQDLQEAAPEFLEDLNSASAHQTGDIRYVMEPAQAAWWLWPIIGSEPFRMRGWRGYGLIGLVLFDGLLLGLMWLGILLVMNAPHPLKSSDLVSVLLGGVISIVWWKGLKPIVRLSNDRVTIASDLCLAWNQFHGQFRLTRDAKSKVAGGWFRMVRHWGYCPICSGEVEIQPGGNAFPGRLIGRCADSPLEHVFSFDPVSLQGSNLR